MAATGKKCVSVSLTPEVLAHINEDAAKFGINRSAYVSMVVEMMHVGVSSPGLADVTESSVADAMSGVLKSAGN